MPADRARHRILPEGPDHGDGAGRETTEERGLPACLCGAAPTDATEEDTEDQQRERSTAWQDGRHPKSGGSGQRRETETAQMAQWRTSSLRCLVSRSFAAADLMTELLPLVDDLERALKADFAFVKAWKGDKWGNLVYRKTARNFNPMMATAAKVTIAEVEHLVEVGELDADLIHTPSIYVQRIFQGELYEKRIEKRTVRRSLVVGR